MLSFHGEVWQTLSKINCNDHIEKKANLSYLSWAWAWGILMEHYPETVYSFKDPIKAEDGTVEIWVTVTVADGEKMASREMWLPVMDVKNKAVVNPDAVEINKTRMRCLTKCLAMFGLGHYIYAGEDLPEAEKAEQNQEITAEQAAELKDLIEKTNTDVKRFLVAFGNPPSVDQMKVVMFATAKGMLEKKLERMS